MLERRTCDDSSRELHRTVCRLLASHAPSAETKARVLEVICAAEGWPFGSFWERDDAVRILRCVSVWHRPDDGGLAELAEMTKALTFAKGLGAPGRAWLTAEPQIIENVRDDTAFARRAAALRAGLRSAVVFPLVHEGDVLGVIDLIGRMPPGDGEVAELFGPIGRRLGEFLAASRRLAAVH